MFVEKVEWIQLFVITAFLDFKILALQIRRSHVRILLDALKNWTWDWYTDYSVISNWIKGISWKYIGSRWLPQIGTFRYF